MLPNNVDAELLKGLLAIFIHSLKLGKPSLEFALEKMTLDKNLITCLTSNLIKDRVVSIFSPISLKCDIDNSSFILEVIQGIQKKIKSAIQNDPNNNIFINNPDYFQSHILPLCYAKGIAIIEITTFKTSSKILIHDPNYLLENISITLMENAIYDCTYNPEESYSAHWNSLENCQLSAYYFIKNTIYKHLKIFSKQITPELLNDKSIALIFLDEIKHNLSLQNELDINFYSDTDKIKRCDGGKFDIISFMTHEYFKVLKISINKSQQVNDLSKFFITEIQHNLGLSNLLEPSEKVTLWNNISWSDLHKLFPPKASTLKRINTKKLNQTNTLSHDKINDSSSNLNAKTIYLLQSCCDSPLLLTKNSNNVLKENTENPILYKIIEFLNRKKTIYAEDLYNLFLSLKKSDSGMAINIPSDFTYKKPAFENSRASSPSFFKPSTSSANSPGENNNDDISPVVKSPQ